MFVRGNGLLLKGQDDRKGGSVEHTTVSLTLTIEINGPNLLS